MGDVFGKAWRDDGGASISSLQSKLASHTLPRGADVAVGIVEDGLVGVVLGTGEAWSYRHAIDARPWIAGNVVVGTGGGRVFALDAATGRPLWSRPATGRVRGAGDDGRTTLVSFEASFRGEGVLVAVGRDGTVLRQLELPVRIGTPVLVANLAFLPWEERNVTVYDLGSGNEIARAVLPHPTSHAFVVGGSVFFGQETVTVFDARIGAGPTVTLPNRELPGDPSWLGSGGVGKLTSSASDTNRVYGKPVLKGEALGFDGDRYYATYRRFVMGLDATTGGLAWVRRVEADSLGGAAYDGGVVLCERTGTVRFYEGLTGASSGQVSLGVRVKACVVQADRLSKGGEP
ncbi:MAG: PQQ-binding-like beta-propeller repeat protein, partial [Coriobacteriia bacterium]|nr:PQQ-binding-like beta-propeller repeat protein [Coriobacteriia bacterium]